MNARVIFSLVFIVCLAHHSCQGAFTSKPPNTSPLKPGKQLKYGYGMVSTKSGKKDHDRKHEIKALVANYDQLRVSHKGKAIYGGASDMKRPRNKRNGSTSMLPKSNTFFSAALKHLAVGFVICVLLII